MLKEKIHIEKISGKLAGKCERHPRYNPAADGLDGVRGNCSQCIRLYEAYSLLLNCRRNLVMLQAMPEFHKNGRGGGSQAKHCIQQPKNQNGKPAPVR